MIVALSIAVVGLGIWVYLLSKRPYLVIDEEKKRTCVKSEWVRN